MANMSLSQAWHWRAFMNMEIEPNRQRLTDPADMIEALKARAR
jgi:hypothetical protein